MAKKLNVKLVDDRILIQRDVPDKITDKGIILPENVKKKPITGHVVAHGPGRYSGGTFVPNSVAVGDYILFANGEGVQVTIDGDEYLLITETHVHVNFGKK